MRKCHEGGDLRGQAGKQQACEAQTRNFPDSVRVSQIPKAHLQILPWISVEEYLIAANSLETGPEWDRHDQGHTESRAPNLHPSPAQESSLQHHQEMAI